MSEEITGDIQIQELTNLAENLNEIIRASGASSAERAFGIGCSLGLIPGMFVIGLLLVFKVIHVILASILLVMVTLVMIGVSTLLSQRAWRSGMNQAYRTRVEAEIARYLTESGLTRAQFDTLVSNLLPQEAPLQAYLFPSDRSER